MSEFLAITAHAMADAIGYMQADTVVYQGVTVFAVASEKESQTLTIGGFESHFAGSARLEKAGFPALSARRPKATFPALLGLTSTSPTSLTQTGRALVGLCSTSPRF